MKTLYDLQRESGKTMAATLDAMREAGVEITQPGLSRLLGRGTQKITVITALAEAWSLDLAVVIAAAEESRANEVPPGAERIPHGRPRKVMTISPVSA
jgi:hypothetical protein